MGNGDSNSERMDVERVQRMKEEESRRLREEIEKTFLALDRWETQTLSSPIRY